MDEPEEVRRTEHRRMKALLNRDLASAREILANDFQLVAPPGAVLTKDQYLGMIESGELRYLEWDAASQIAVRFYNDVAVIRYQARIEIEFGGQKTPSALYWFTDLYEKRASRWQIVWSQGTQAADVQLKSLRETIACRKSLKRESKEPMP